MNYLVFLFALLWINISLSCDCQVRLLNHEYSNSDVVIHGIVLSEKIYELAQSRDYLDSLEQKMDARIKGKTWAKEYTILVKENLKNALLTDTIFIRTNYSSNCQLSLRVGENYLLFARNIQSLDLLFDAKTSAFVFQTNQCSLTQKFKRNVRKKLRKFESTKN